MYNLFMNSFASLTLCRRSSCIPGLLLDFLCLLKCGNCMVGEALAEHQT